MTTLRSVLDWSTRDWALKLTALALAFLLWTTVRAEAPGSWQAEMEVHVVNNDGDWVLAEPPSPGTVTAELRGPVGELLRAASDRPSITVRVQQVRDSMEYVDLSPNWVRMPPGTANTVVTGFRPAFVQLRFDRVSTRLIPLAVEVTGEPAPGYRLMGRPEIEPSVVRASGARRDLNRFPTLQLPGIDLRDRRAMDTLEMTIDTTGTGLIISPRTVRVVVPIRPILDGDTGTGRGGG
jgi:hypothetical protein